MFINHVRPMIVFTVLFTIGSIIGCGGGQPGQAAQENANQAPESTSVQATTTITTIVQTESEPSPTGAPTGLEVAIIIGPGIVCTCVADEASTLFKQMITDIDADASSLKTEQFNIESLVKAGIIEAVPNAEIPKSLSGVVSESGTLYKLNSQIYSRLSSDQLSQLLSNTEGIQAFDAEKVMEFDAKMIEKKDVSISTNVKIEEIESFVKEAEANP